MYKGISAIALHMLMTSDPSGEVEIALILSDVSPEMIIHPTELLGKAIFMHEAKCSFTLEGVTKVVKDFCRKFHDSVAVGDPDNLGRESYIFKNICNIPQESSLEDADVSSIVGSILERRPFLPPVERVLH